jgi:hypothetical protein
LLQPHVLIFGEIQFTDDYGNYQRDYNPNEFSVDVAYSRLFSEHWSGGVCNEIHLLKHYGGMTWGTTETKAGIAFAADASAYYTTGSSSEHVTEIFQPVSISQISVQR